MNLLAVGFLQPWMLWALPLVLLPIVIHLLNQWRYQTKPWAAMMFLLAAKSLQQGMAKIRQWLILILRALAIAGMIFAISRPLASGFMGIIGGQVDTTIVLIDRSPSMTQRNISNGETKLETGLRQLRQSLEQAPSARWISIDSATLKNREFSSAGSLLDSPYNNQTATQAHWPSLLSQTLEYIQTNRPATVNIWMCSDMRVGDWDPNNSQWKLLQPEFAKYSGSIRFFSLQYPQKTAVNRSIRVENIRRESSSVTEGLSEVVLSIQVRHESQGNSNASRFPRETLPVQLSLNGTPSQVELELIDGFGELKDLRIPIEAQEKGGWGKASLPSDENSADNEFYFVFDTPSDRRTLLVSEDPNTLYPVQIAASVSREPRLKSTVELIDMEALEKSIDILELESTSLIVWQGMLPQGAISDRLKDYLAQGGTIWFFPPNPNRMTGSSNRDTASSSFDSDVNTIRNSPESVFGFEWGRWNELVEPIKPVQWRNQDGLLEATRSGTSLPVGEITFSKYVNIEGDFSSLASVNSKNDPLIARINRNLGTTFVWTTLPIEPFSNLDKNGVVLFVATQRAIDLGLTASSNAIQYSPVATISQAKESAISTLPASSKLSSVRTSRFQFENWEAVSTSDDFLTSETGYHRGVYRQGDRWFAVNRSALEEEAAVVEASNWKSIFEGLNIQTIEDVAGSQRSIQQEIWRAFWILMILAMIFEALFSLPRKTRRVANDLG